MQSEMRPNPRTEGLRASDAEITRPLNEGPLQEEHGAPAWHVHLELHPDELAKLHRMGFTSGALAWREGMNDWQPLSVGTPPPLEPPHKRTEQSVSGNLPMALVRRRAPAASAGNAAFDGSSSEERPHSHSDLAPRLQAFTQRARTIPPLASPMSVPVIGLPTRQNLEALPPPPPPPIDQLPNFDAWDSAAHLSSHSSLPHLSDSAIREVKPLSVPPPVEIPSRPLRPSSRALWLGAAALVALSASNGALVSALLWSLRHSATASVAALSRSFNASMCPAPTSTLGAAAPKPSAPAAAAVVAPVAVGAAASESSKGAAPVSIEELPLATDSKAEHAASKPRAESHAASPRIGSASRAARSKGTRGAGAEEVPSSSKKVAPASEGPDRDSMAKALSLASASASTCSDGPERGRVAVTFAPSGSVQGVRLIQNFGDASVNSCVLRAMGRAHVAPFSGDSVTVTKTLSW